LLERDPRVDAPRETESVAGAFNRHMDAAIDSLNDSVARAFRASAAAPGSPRISAAPAWSSSIDRKSPS
jgi:hypothetical protein